MLQNILDAMAMIIADLCLRKPSSYADLGIVLYEAGLVSEETKNHVKRIALTKT